MNSVARRLAACVLAIAAAGALAGCPAKNEGNDGAGSGAAEAPAGASSAAGSTAGVFTATTLQEAKAAAARTTPARLVVAVFDAEWSLTCREMDETTWADQDVKTWFASRGVGVKVDVDSDRALAESMGVNAVPSILVLRGDEVVAREVGVLEAERLLEWLKGLDVK